MRPILLLLACLPALPGQSLSGTWCNTANARDCVTIRQSGESIQTEFVMNGRSTGEGVGWTRTGRLAVAFRRLDNIDLATWTAELDAGGRLSGRTANSNGTLRWTGVYAREGAPSTPVSGNVDPTGTWQHVAGASWVITAAGPNRYQAQERGLGEAAGPGYFTENGTFRIDYVTRDGVIKGYYEMRFANDNRTAAGTVRELTGPKRSGPSNWVRIGGGTPSSTGGEPWLPGSFDWVSGQFLVVHPQKRITVYLNGSKINEGAWEYLGGNRFRFTHEKGGYIDTVELSPDGKYLTGRNNFGNELRGTRRVTSPRP